MREELRRLDSLDAQMRYMAAHKIETLDDLHANLAATENELAQHLEVRKKLQNQIRRATPKKKEELQAEKTTVTEAITALRKQKNLALAIEDRATRIDTAMEQLMENEDRATNRTRTSRERSYER